MDVATGVVLYESTENVFSGAMASLFFSNAPPLYPSGFRLFYVLDPFSPVAHLINTNSNIPTRTTYSLVTWAHGVARNGFLYFWTQSHYFLSKATDPGLVTVSTLKLPLPIDIAVFTDTVGYLG